MIPRQLESGLPRGEAESSPAPLAATADEVAAVAASTPDESVFVFPATLAQRRFWLLDKMQPGGNPALNMPLPMRLQGPLDPTALQRALNKVVARHEALRTVFASERGELRQHITPNVILELPQLDERNVAEADRAAVSARLIREETEKPFDLAIGPLIRGRLAQFSESEHLFLLTVHHIVTDGWSNGVLMREIFACYTAFVAGTEPALPELPIQFADYADWQHERLAANDFSWQREYWRQQLSGDLPVLDLPTDRPRLSGLDNSGDLRSRVLTPELVQAAKTLAAREGASPFMLFLAVFEALLYRYTGQTDFLVTTPSANRQRQEFEPLIGLFVNPLLLRADLRDDPTFTELLSGVRGVALDAFVNQDAPFELLLDEFQPSRLQVNFLYQSAFVENTKLPGGLAIEPLDYASAGTVYDLSASLFESAEGVRLELEYNSSLFEPATIERMLGHYVTLLKSALADPTQPISVLALLTAEERSALEPSVADSEHRTLDIRGPLLERVMAQTDAIAVRHGKREMSCAELLARMESARNAARSERAPSDLEQAATWVGHWRARAETSPPAATARSAEMDGVIASACLALRDSAALRAGERAASFSVPGFAAAEELGAAILSGAMLVYPTPELLADSAAALATWLEREQIAVAFLPAATWNRLAASFGRKIVKPARLRLVIATEGDASEGMFGQITADPHGGSSTGLRVYTRTVIDGAGTILLNGQRFAAAGHLRVLDLRSDQLLPVGIAGELAIADGREVVRLGKLARWRQDGLLDRLGLLDQQIYDRSCRVDLRPVERALCTLPGIRHALVRAAQSESSLAYTAYLLPNLSVGALPNDAAMRRLLRAKGLPNELIPSAFVRLKELPLRVRDGRFDASALPPAPVVQSTTDSEPVRPYLGLQLQLIAIWEEVLGVRGIGIRDDFFHLGGNSLLAMRMLQRAETACGKEILPTALFANPTIEHLAGEMARDVIKDSPTLLRVHDAGKRTPFFYLHGDLSGGGFYSLTLSRSLGPDQPFYVMPPQDIGLLPAAPSVSEMATAHLEAIRPVRPKGPYVIGGFCVGGLVAYELARQIEASGETVEMLLIIDAAPEEKMLRFFRSLAERGGRLLGWNDEKKVARFGRWTLWRTRVTDWCGMDVGAQSRLVAEEIRHRFRSAFGRSRRRLPQRGDANNETAGVVLERDLPSAFLWASAGYRPQPYRGPAALLVSEDVLRSGGKQLAPDWRALAPQVTVHPLAGSHLECITAHVETLAETIDRCLQSVRQGGAESSAEPLLVPLPLTHGGDR